MNAIAFITMTSKNQSSLTDAEERNISVEITSRKESEAVLSNWSHRVTFHLVLAMSCWLLYYHYSLPVMKIYVPSSRRVTVSRCLKARKTLLDQWWKRCVDKSATATVRLYLSMTAVLNRNSSVGIATMLRVGRPRNLNSIPGSGRRFLVSP